MPFPSAFQLSRCARGATSSHACGERCGASGEALGPALPVPPALPRAQVCPSGVSWGDWGVPPVGETNLPGATFSLSCLPLQSQPAPSGPQTHLGPAAAAAVHRAAQPVPDTHLATRAALLPTAPASVSPSQQTPYHTTTVPPSLTQSGPWAQSLCCFYVTMTSPGFLLFS